MNWREYIVSDDDIMMGKPCIQGTRITIEHIVGLLAQGWSEEQILENYPRVTKSSLHAIFAYLQECIADGLLYNSTKEIA